MVQPLEGTKTGKDAIARVSYTHDAMIDVILANPSMTQVDLSKYFGYTEGWVSRVMGSDAFNARMAERKGEIVNPGILATMDEKIKGLALHSIDVLQRKLEATSSPDIAIKSLELATKAMGMGARISGPTNVQNNYVVALPPKVGNETEWAAAASQSAAALAERSRVARERALAGEVIDVTPKA